MAINLSTLVNQTNPLQLCKAWLSYNATTQTVRSSYNVSSVTYTSNGLFTINLTTALTDANYSVVGMISGPGTTFNTICENSAVTRTTSSFGVTCLGAGGGVYNSAYVSIAIFGN